MSATLLLPAAWGPRGPHACPSAPSLLLREEGSGETRPRNVSRWRLSASLRRRRLCGPSAQWQPLVSPLSEREFSVLLFAARQRWLTG